MDEWCACGQPLHYTDPLVRGFIEGLIAELGPDINVRFGDRMWRVPRHYIALHGLTAGDLPTLGFPEVQGHGGGGT